MNRITATALSLTLGLTNCATDASVESHFQTATAYGEGDIGRISTDTSGKTDSIAHNTDANSDSGKGVVPDENPCNKLDSNWKTLLAGEYVYSPPPKIGTDRATLEGVSKEQVLALAQLVNAKVVTELCYAQKTINPVDTAGDAVRQCDSIEVKYNGEPTPENEDVYVVCHVKDPLPQGPALLPQYDKEIIEDRVDISANTAIEFSPESGNTIGLDVPAIYKTRIIEEINSRVSPLAFSFFLNSGDQDPKSGTGDFKRRSRIWISGR